jgi:hypothetical protein
VADLQLEPGGSLDSALGHEEIGLARAESLIETPLSPSVVDLHGCVITFEVPAELDVWVVCRVPYLGSVRRGSLVTVYLTDQLGNVTDASALKAATRRHVGFVTLDELVPAGSGTVTRKLRGQASRGAGYANLEGLGRVTMDAYIR